VETFFVKNINELIWPTNTKIYCCWEQQLVERVAQKNNAGLDFGLTSSSPTGMTGRISASDTAAILSDPALFQRYFQLTVEQFADLLGLVERFHWSTQLLSLG